MILGDTIIELDTQSSPSWTAKGQIKKILIIKLTRSQYLTTRQPVQAFNSASVSICLFPKQPEQVSSRRNVSRTATKGTVPCRTSSPTLMSDVAKRPLPMPSEARGSVLVITDGIGLREDIFDVFDVHSSVDSADTWKVMVCLVIHFETSGFHHAPVCSNIKFDI